MSGTEIGGTMAVASSNTYFFTNTACNDMLVYPDTSNQRILIGTKSNAAAVVVVNSNNLAVVGDIVFSGNLLQNGVPYSSGVGFSNFGSNLFIIGSNISIGVSNPVEQFQIKTGNARFDCNVYVMSNIGVGTAAPGYQLDVSGDINFTGTLRQNGAAYVGSQWSNTVSNVYLLGSNVGICTNTPAEAFHVARSNARFDCNVYVMSNLGIGKTNPAYALDVNGAINAVGYCNLLINSWTSASTSNAPTSLALSNVYGFTVWNSNTALTACNIALWGSNTALTACNIAQWGSNTALTACNIAQWGSNTALTACNIALWGSNAGAAASNRAFNTWNFSGSNIFELGSNVGIGTNTPSEAFHVSSSNAKFDCNVYVLSNLGIATSNPSAALHVASNMRVDGAVQIYNALQFTGVEFLPGMVQNNYTQLIAATSNIQGYSNMVYGSGAGSSNGTMFSIMSNTSNDAWRWVSGLSSNEVMRLTGNGLLGVGTSNPSTTLHVAGNTSFLHNNVYNTGTAGWYNIGLWDSSSNANNGAKLVLRIIGSSLYSGGVTNGSQSGGEARIFLNNLNNAVTSVVNVDGSWMHFGGSLPVVSTVKVVQNGANRAQYYIYAYLNTYTQHVLVPETTYGSSFTPQFTSTTDPGANTATVQLLSMSMSAMGNTGINTVPSTQHTVLIVQPTSVAVGVNLSSSSGSNLLQLYATNSNIDGNASWFNTTTAPFRLTREVINNYSIHGMGHIKSDMSMFCSNLTAIDTLNAGGFLAIGGSAQTGNHALLINQKTAPVGINVANGNGVTGFQVNCANGISGTARSDAVVCVGSSSGRSITALGSINAANGDFAEYVYKAQLEDVFQKGELVGIDVDGKVTKKFSQSISFAVVSSAPGYVASDDWCNLGPRPTDRQSSIQWDLDYAEQRKMVEEIAFCGRVPVLVGVCMVGDYISAGKGENDCIIAIASRQVVDWSKVVGRVWNIKNDVVIIKVIHM